MIGKKNEFTVARKGATIVRISLWTYTPPKPAARVAALIRKPINEADDPPATPEYNSQNAIPPKAAI